MYCTFQPFKYYLKKSRHTQINNNCRMSDEIRTFPDGYSDVSVDNWKSLVSNRNVDCLPNIFSNIII